MGYNMFAYCNNSPGNGFDPNGEQEFNWDISYDGSGNIADNITSAYGFSTDCTVSGGGSIDLYSDVGTSSYYYSSPQSGSFDSTFSAYSDPNCYSYSTYSTIPQAEIVGGSIPSETALQPYYPPNNGFLGEVKTVTLEPGTILQRSGSLGGRYVAPAGTPLEMLSLPADKIGQPLTHLKVNYPIQVQAGLVAPWFGQMGFGTQYYLSHSINTLIRHKILEALK